MNTQHERGDIDLSSLRADCITAQENAVRELVPKFPQMSWDGMFRAIGQRLGNAYRAFEEGVITPFKELKHNLQQTMATFSAKAVLAEYAQATAFLRDRTKMEIIAAFRKCKHKEAQKTDQTANLQKEENRLKKLLRLQTIGMAGDEKAEIDHGSPNLWNIRLLSVLVGGAIEALATFAALREAQDTTTAIGTSLLFIGLANLTAIATGHFFAKIFGRKDSKKAYGKKYPCDIDHDGKTVEFFDLSIFTPLLAWSSLVAFFALNATFLKTRFAAIGIADLDETIVAVGGAVLISIASLIFGFIELSLSCKYEERRIKEYDQIAADLVSVQSELQTLQRFPNDDGVEKEVAQKDEPGLLKRFYISVFGKHEEEKTVPIPLPPVYQNELDKIRQRYTSAIQARMEAMQAKRPEFRSAKRAYQHLHRQFANAWQIVMDIFEATCEECAGAVKIQHKQDPPKFDEDEQEKLRGIMLAKITREFEDTDFDAELEGFDIPDVEFPDIREELAEFITLRSEAEAIVIRELELEQQTGKTDEVAPVMPVTIFKKRRS